MREGRKCGTCYWWHKPETECRVESPRVFPSPDDPYDSVSFFPRIAEGEWCGKWCTKNVWEDGELLQGVEVEMQEMQERQVTP